jgi:hypothetical protein
MTKNKILFQLGGGFEDKLPNHSSLTEANITDFPTKIGSAEIDNSYYNTWLQKYNVVNTSGTITGTINITGGINKVFVVKELYNVDGSSFSASALEERSPGSSRSSDPTFGGVEIANGKTRVYFRGLLIRDYEFGPSIVFSKDGISAFSGVDLDMEPTKSVDLKIYSTPVSISSTIIVSTNQVYISKPASVATLQTTKTGLSVSGDLSVTGKIYGSFSFSTSNYKTSFTPSEGFEFPDIANFDNFITYDSSTSGLNTTAQINTPLLKPRTPTANPKLLTSVTFTYRQGYSVAIFSSFVLSNRYPSNFVSTQFDVVMETGSTIVTKSVINTHQFEDHNWPEEGYSYPLVNQLVILPTSILMNSNPLQDNITYRVNLYVWCSGVEKYSTTQDSSNVRDTFTYQSVYFNTVDSSIPPLKSESASISVFGIPTQ